MRIAAISEFKAKLAKYLRLVKAGEQIEIQDRGIPVALLSGARKIDAVLSVPPRRDPRLLAKMKFRTHAVRSFDVVALLAEDRAKR